MPKTPLDPDYHISDPDTGELIYSPSLLELEEFMLMKRNYLNDDGAEQPDPTPIAPPVGYKKAPSLVENMRAMIREHALAMAIAGSEAETFEEADDFDVADDFDPTSPWEGEFEPVADINRDILDPASPRARKKPTEPAQGSSTPQPSSEAQASSQAKPGTHSGGSGGGTPPEGKTGA